jgi:hypothetical protein
MTGTAGGVDHLKIIFNLVSQITDANGPGRLYMARIGSRKTVRELSSLRGTRCVVLFPLSPPRGEGIFGADRRISQARPKTTSGLLLAKPPIMADHARGPSNVPHPP